MTTHAHSWTPVDGEPRWSCTGCVETTAACSECSRPVEDSASVCHVCVGRARRVVLDIIDSIRQVPVYQVEILGLSSTRYDAAATGSTSDRDRLPFGLDALVEDPETPWNVGTRFPSSALSILDSWARRWHDQRHLPPAETLQYLVDRTPWAVEHQEESGWVEYIEDAREVRRVVRRLLGTAPVPDPIPCVACGGQVGREWTPDGLEDVRRCSRCGAFWEDERALLVAHRAALLLAPQLQPDRLVTLDDACLMLPDLERATVRKVLQRDRQRTDPTHKAYLPGWSPRLPIQGWDAAGRRLFVLGDLMRLVPATSTSRR